MGIDFFAGRIGRNVTSAVISPDRAVGLAEAVFASMAEGLFTIDRSGLLVTMNEAAERIIGWTIDELRGKNMHDAVHYKHPDGKPFAVGECKAYSVLESGHAVIDVDDVFIHKDGSFVEVRYTSSPLIDSGEVIGIVVVFRDVSERRRMQRDQEFLFDLAEKIRTSRSAADLLAEISRSVGTYLELRRCLFNEIDLELDIATVRSDYCRTGESITGNHKLSDYSEIAGESLRSGKTVVNRDTKNDSRTARYFEKTYGPKQALAYVAVPLLRSGKWVATLWCSDDHPRNWTDREVALLENVAERTWAAVERANAEHALRESEKRLRLATQASGFGFYDFDAVSGISYWTAEMYRLAGIAEGTTVTAETAINQTHPDDRERVERSLQASLDPKGSGIFNEEFRIVRPDNGETRWFYNHGQTYFEGSGESRRPVRNTGVVVDVTETKRAQAALERYRLLSENARDIFWFARNDGRILEVNRAAVDAYGYTREELLQMSISDLRERSTLPLLSDQLEKAATAGIHFETVHVRKDGSTFPVEVNAASANFEGEQLIMSVVRDVTERKAVEEALRASQRRLVATQTHAPIGIVELALDGRYLNVNDEFCRITGYTHDELLRLNFRDITHDEDRTLNSEMFEQLVAGELPFFRLEKRFVRKDGSPVWVSVNRALVKDAEGKPLYVVGAILDITERKKAEEVSMRLAAIVSSSSDAIISKTLDGIITTWNESATQMFGYSAEEIVGRSIRLLIPLERQAEEDMILGRLRNGESIEHYETVRVAKDGRRLDVSLTISPLKNSAGKIIGASKIIHDISERKKAEDALRESMNELSRFNRAAVGRELRMIELKKEVNDLHRRLRKDKRYPLEFEKEAKTTNVGNENEISENR